MNNYFLILLYLSLQLFIIPSLTFPVLAKESGAKTSLTAKIPYKTDIRLFGYTSPLSLVQASGIRIYAEVSSDRSGYFMFEPLPISIEAKEICLTTLDAEGRSGFPVCIPLPESDRPTEIGPVLLSPTISLTSDSILQKETASAFGKTLPLAKVNISFFNSPGTKMASLRLIPEVEAADLPIISTTSDRQGNFSINLPNTRILSYKIFAKAYYEEAPTFKSQTLSFRVNSIVGFWIRYILLFALLLIFLIALIILLVIYERKTKALSKAWNNFKEKKLKPFEVYLRLSIKRVWYNFKGYISKRS